jgi:methionine biosynthesis protein MetW
VTRHLPHTWYNTPNIHMCTVRDFEALCAEEHIEILQHEAVDSAHRSALAMRLLPNLFSEVGLYRFRRRV